MSFGLTQKDISLIQGAATRYTSIEEIIIFGSRAMGNFKNGSDVDLVIKGEDIDHSIVTNISIILNEQLPLPYKFDVLNFSDISNNKLLEHIKSFGQVLYKRTLP